MNFNIEKPSLVFVKLILLFLGSCNEGVVNEQSLEAGDHVIIAYVVGSRVQDFTQIQGDKLTHINYAFANISDRKVVEGGGRACCCWHSGQLVLGELDDNKNFVLNVNG